MADGSVDSLQFVEMYGPFSAQISIRCKAVAQRVSSLLSIVAGSNEGAPGLAEKRLLEDAREAALVTTQLIAYVEEHRNQWLDISKHQDQCVLLQVELLENTTGIVRDMMLQLLRCAKEAFDNPYDYMTLQKFTSAANDVHTSVKDVRNAVVMLRLTISKFLSGDDSAISSKSAQLVSHVVDSCQVFAARVQSLVELVQGGSSEEDPEPALEAMKHVVVALKGVIDAQQQSKLELGEQVKHLKLTTQSLLTRARSILLDGQESRDSASMHALSSCVSSLSMCATELILKAQQVQVQEIEELDASHAEEDSETPRGLVHIASRQPMGSSVKQVLDLFKGQLAGFSQVWESTDPEIRRAVVSQLSGIFQHNTDKKQKKRNRASTALQKLAKANIADDSAKKQLDMFMGVSDLSQWQAMLAGANEPDLIHVGGLVGDISFGRQEPLSDVEALAQALKKAAIPFIVNSNAAVLSKKTSTAEVLQSCHLVYEGLCQYLRMLHQHTENTVVQSLLAHALSVVSNPTISMEPDQYILVDATQSLAQLTFSGMLRQLYRHSNGVRTLVLYALTTLRSLPDKPLHPDSGVLQLIACAQTLSSVCSPLLNIVSTARHFSSLSSNDDLPPDDEEDADEVGLWQEYSLMSQSSDDLKTIPTGKKLSRSAKKFGSRKLDPSSSSRGSRGSRSSLRKEKAQAAAAAVAAMPPPPAHGTLNELVMALTPSSKFNAQYTKCFLTTYRSFTTPRMLFQKLLERYQVPDKIAEKERGVIRRRVPVVLQRWVEAQPDDFEDSLFAQLYEFADTLVADGLEDHSILLRTELDKQSNARRNRKAIFESPPIDFTPPSGKYSPSALFLVLSSEEIARQMSIIDHQLYAAIEPSELMNQNWSKAKYRHRAANVYALINRLNTVSHWIPSMILWQDDLHQRVLMLEKLIEISQHVRKMNNFNTLMGFIAGLNMASIGRLKKTWERVSAELVESFRGFEKLMSPSSSFKAYRTALAAAELPAIPYLGTHLSDLTFIDEGNPDLVEGKINWEKREQIFAVLTDLAKFRISEYSFPVVEPAHTFLLQLPALDDKQLYDLSLNREPRE